MVVEVIMPKLGQTMEEGKIIKWLKKEGERVEKGEPLIEIETDKTILEVEARGSGVLRKILAREDDVVPVTKTIGYIAEEGEAIPEEAAPAPTAPIPTATATKTPSMEKPKVKTARIKASPLAKKIAEEKGIDLSRVTGTGPGGRITKDDVLSHLASKAAVTAPTLAPTLAEELEAIPMSGMRKAIAKKMVYSKTNIPHFYVSTEVDMTEAAKMRQNLIPEIEAKTGVRLSFTHVLIRSVAMALKEFPQINAIYDNGNIKLAKEINIGIAVGLEEGLIVPVLKGADRMDLIQIASKTSRLVAKTREKRLREDEFVGGTFTISNMGAFDVDSFIAIINPPETAILAVGRTKEKPAVVEGRIEVRSMMTITLSADHRIVDGVLAAKFLQRIKATLEAPYNLLGPR
ncbi:MAG: 2-oxo acid dehydrogenase subunit E2 [Aigarchaeota archaeon]|nr:2-oxo acid dehydrogenase subunit E2 [Aigarchaeota archaeon]MDH5702959.1 2-oxo acid dehydrogenase subunit E2 [Aigarchaeota archaeon]